MNEIYKCAVCNYRLNELNDEQVHPAVITGHTPVPVLDPDDTAFTVCDFCTSDKIAYYRHPCADFVVDGLFQKNDGKDTKVVHSNFNGDWAACQQCHELILGENVAGLVERSVNRQIAWTRRAHPTDSDEHLNLLRELLTAQVTEVHEGFFRYRTGKFTELASRGGRS